MELTRKLTSNVEDLDRTLFELQAQREQREAECAAKEKLNREQRKRLVSQVQENQQVRASLTEADRISEEQYRVGAAGQARAE